MFEGGTSYFSHVINIDDGAGRQRRLGGSIALVVICASLRWRAFLANRQFSVKRNHRENLSFVRAQSYSTKNFWPIEKRVKRIDFLVRQYVHNLNVGGTTEGQFISDGSNQ